MKVLFEFDVKADKLEMFVEFLNQIKAQVDLNEDCSFYEYLVVSDQKVIVIEHWSSDKALSLHRSSSLIQNFRHKIDSYLLRPRLGYVLEPLNDT